MNPNHKENLLFINRELTVQSLLYDLNLMPEQLKEGSEDWLKMLNIVAHFQAFRNEIEKRCSK
jgi:hypothetical protein